MFTVEQPRKHSVQNTVNDLISRNKLRGTETEIVERTKWTRIGHGKSERERETDRKVTQPIIRSNGSYERNQEDEFEESMKIYVGNVLHCETQCYSRQYDACLL